jgi:hypothetical protein
MEMMRCRDDRRVERPVGERGVERRVRERTGAGGDRSGTLFVGIDRGGDDDRDTGTRNRVQMPLGNRPTSDHDRTDGHVRSTTTGNRSK